MDLIVGVVGMGFVVEWEVRVEVVVGLGLDLDLDLGFVEGVYEMGR